MNSIGINSTQNVSLHFDLASVGNRFLAQFIDTLVKIGYIAIVFTILSTKKDFFFGWDQWSMNGFFILIFLPIAFYTLVFEFFWDGQTLGKKAAKIKVIKIEGFQPAFHDYFTRWILRIIDINISMGIIGLLSIIISKKEQRFGDILAGTAVVRIHNKWGIRDTFFQEIKKEHVVTYPLVTNLKDSDIHIIRNVLKRSLRENDRVKITKLAQKIEPIIGKRLTTQTKEQFIRTVLKDYNYLTQEDLN
jgi:uncharacterized RDD family membrane protein YckC